MQDYRVLLQQLTIKRIVVGTVKMIVRTTACHAKEKAETVGKSDYSWSVVGEMGKK